MGATSPGAAPKKNKKIKYPKLRSKTPWDKLNSPQLNRRIKIFNRQVTHQGQSVIIVENLGKKYTEARTKPQVEIVPLQEQKLHYV